MSELPDSFRSSACASSSWILSADATPVGAPSNVLAIGRGTAIRDVASELPWWSAASSDCNVGKLGVDLDRRPGGVGFPLLLGGMSFG